MVTHIGLLTLKEGTTDESREAIGQGLLGLLGQINGLTRVQIGNDLGLKEGNGNVIFLLTFESEEAWRAYGAHPAHKAVIAEAIAPVIASTAFVQIDGYREAQL
ncbi:Dabb family protein [Salinibacterium sp. NK8237]|uniref:Dabb family protein n=1 Tax=Salinibacterium sp. NK8237 TaxID=2792038 RepID=UPI0018CD4D20|nr:Dabb family protein [Salinibacterium sp. NK8237]MBH0130649.1 Dabb family protein [Salinibacterium sp. NK8237]